MSYLPSVQLPPAKVHQMYKGLFPSDIYFLQHCGVKSSKGRAKKRLLVICKNFAAVGYMEKDSAVVKEMVKHQEIEKVVMQEADKRTGIFRKEEQTSVLFKVKKAADGSRTKPDLLLNLVSDGTNMEESSGAKNLETILKAIHSSRYDSELTVEWLKKNDSKNKITDQAERKPPPGYNKPESKLSDVYGRQPSEAPGQSPTQQEPSASPPPGVAEVVYFISEKNETTGKYAFMPGVEQQGMPVWGRPTGERLYVSNTTGVWVIGTTETMNSDASWVRAASREHGKLPWEISAWQAHKDGKWSMQINTICTTDSDLAEALHLQSSVTAISSKLDQIPVTSHNKDQVQVAKRDISEHAHLLQPKRKGESFTGMA